MATVNLYPDSTLGQLGSAWTLTGAATKHEALQDDDASNYLHTATVGASNVFTLDNLDSDGLNIDSINSVQVVIEAFNNARGSSTDYKTIIQNSGGNTIHEETITRAATGTYVTLTYNARTECTHPNCTNFGGMSQAWTDADIDGIKLYLEADAISTGIPNVTQMYLIVDYEEGGYVNTVMGVPSGDISSVNGVATGNISKVNGV